MTEIAIMVDLLVPPGLMSLATGLTSDGLSLEFVVVVPVVDPLEMGGKVLVVVVDTLDATVLVLAGMLEVVVIAA